MVTDLLASQSNRKSPAAHGPDFSIEVENNGYAWWYVDALSRDGEHGLTIIAFIGSVFSPYYAAARRKGSVNPLNHCAINVALYGRGGKRWAMTERGLNAVSRDQINFQVGPSALYWDGASLTIDINEICVPIPRSLRGKVRVTPRAMISQTFVLAESGLHQWQPIAPKCDVEATFQSPTLQWSGTGYFDRNCGSSPLEKAFLYWTWSRSGGANDTMIFYDVDRRHEGQYGLALHIDCHGGVTHMTAPPKAKLASSLWGIPRETRSDETTPAKVVKTLEDTPFYARSVVSSSISGVATQSVHEALSLDRFRTPIVQGMLPFRMPRKSW